jgi:hypothetical protein
VLHGNWLLRGWVLGDASYYTTELPQYVLIEIFRGLSSEIVHICGAITYTLLVVLASLLATRSPSRLARSFAHSANPPIPTITKLGP